MDFDFIERPSDPQTELESLEMDEFELNQLRNAMKLAGRGNLKTNNNFKKQEDNKQNISKMENENSGFVFLFLGKTNKFNFFEYFLRF